MLRARPSGALVSRVRGLLSPFLALAGLVACGPTAADPTAATSATTTASATAGGTTSDATTSGTSGGSTANTSSSGGGTTGLECPPDVIEGEACEPGQECEYSDIDRCVTGQATCTCFLGWSCTCAFPHYPECSLWEQDCPEGEKCTVLVNDGGNSLNAFECSPVAPDPKGLDEPCVASDPNGLDGIDDCDKGLVCWNVHEGQGYCASFCTGDPGRDPNAASCPDGKACDVDSIGIPRCLTLCDPLDPGACPEHEVCVLWSLYGPSGNFACVESQGMAGEGEECVVPQHCSAGHCRVAKYLPGCVGSEACCTPYCDTLDPEACAGKGEGVACQPLFGDGEAPPGVEHVGVCSLPFP